MRKLTVATILAMTAAFCLLSSVFCPLTYANDVNVYDVILQSLQGTGASTTVDVKFSVSQSNTFPSGLVDGNSAAYYDRVWIFVKYFRSDWAADTAWKHATLTTGGTVGAYSGGIGLAADGKGAFVTPGPNKVVRWTIGAATDETSSVDTSKTYKVRVYAIEMVLIPTGAFELGDGNATSESYSAFHVTDNTKVGTIGTTLVGSIKVDVNTYDDAQIESPGIGIDGDGGIDSDNNGTIDNANFPTGYNAFYIMKYDIAQKDYCNFLNTLTTTQAARRIDTTHFNAYRNYILKSSDTPARYGCYASVPTATWGTVPISSMNGSADGQWIACNFLSWQDLCAYADWAGLRPMTELEFEKACRGGGVAAAYQDYPWGTTAAYASTAYTLSNPGAVNESIATNYSATLGNINTTTTWNAGPMRCGIFALSTNSGTSGKVASGASYYGVMDLAGNLFKRCVTVGHDTSGTVLGGRAFLGTHGDGYLTTLASYDGNATNSDWPGYDTSLSTRGINAATGIGGGRGGGWWYNVSYGRVSDRGYAADWRAGRDNAYGGRCARTSP